MTHFYILIMPSVYHIQCPWLPLIFKITYQIFP